MHIVHALFTKYKGGLEQAYINDTKALIATGHRITAFVRADAPYIGELRECVSEVRTFMPRGFYDFRAIIKMFHELARLRPDAVIAHNGRAIQLMFFACVGLKIPVVGVSHSYKTRRIKKCDALIVLSEHMRQHFEKKGYPAAKMRVIPNLLHLPNEPHFQQRRKPIVIGAIGRFTGEKGFDDLLLALRIVKLNGFEFKAIIAGDGPLAEDLKAKAKHHEVDSHIEWAGWVKNKTAFYRSLDILCLPSLKDSFPMVLLEALTHKVPILATDVPGAISMLHDGEDGLIVPRGQPIAFARELIRMIENQELCSYMAEGGWQTVQQYGFSHVAGRWNEVLGELLPQPDHSKQDQA